MSAQGGRIKVVLYNPRAVFFTMPLALLAIGSELDPEIYEVVTIDGRLHADAEALRKRALAITEKAMGSDHKDVATRLASLAPDLLGFRGALCEGGDRTLPLTADRAKPAVHFGGIYRIIDFVLSNLVNSGFHRIKVLTQYKSDSLSGWPSPSKPASPVPA